MNGQLTKWNNKRVKVFKHKEVTAVRIIKDTERWKNENSYHNHCILYY